MKKEHVETLVDSFVDDHGDTRYFVVAAISEVFTKDEEPVNVFNVNDEFIQEVVKGLKIGFSICNPADKFDEKLGITIAVGRARKNNNYAIFATKPGYINTTLVRAFLKQEAEYFKHNPEYKIAGYVK